MLIYDISSRLTGTGIFVWRSKGSEPWMIEPTLTKELNFTKPERNALLAHGSQDKFVAHVCNAVITGIIHVCYLLLSWPLRFSRMLVLNLYKEDYLQIFKCISF